MISSVFNQKLKFQCLLVQKHMQFMCENWKQSLCNHIFSVEKKARETIFTNFVSIHAIQLKNRPYCKHTIAQRGNPENSYTGEILSQQSLSSFFFPNSEYKTFF